MSDYEKSVADRLAQLGTEFNTNKGFGFMGQLENNLDPQSDAARALVNGQPAQPSLDQALQQAPVVPPPAPAPDLSIMEPINTAMQGLRSDTSQELQAIRNQISELKSMQSAVPPAADGTPDPVLQKLAQMEQAHHKLHRSALQDRARSALQQARSQYPDADLGDNDFNLVWNGNKLDDNLGMAESVNWKDHWDMVAKAKSLPKLQEKMRNHEMEIERLRSNKPTPLQEMSTAPRTNRQGGLPQTSLMGTDGFDEDLYQDAVNIMGGADRAKGRFMGFNRALNEAQRRRSFGNVR